MSLKIYRKEIDGIRALAVLPVIIFHLNSSWAPGGFLGVDIFFVISGFLITLGIIESYNDDSFSIFRFWLRRARRILPALLLMVGTVLTASYFLFYSLETISASEDALYALLSITNIKLWINEVNYWGSGAEGNLFLHTWSLSLEEQFYLFFPLVMIFCLRYKGFFSIIILSIAVLFSLFGYFYFLSSSQNTVFYLIPFRSWELLSGSLVALVISERKNLDSNRNVVSVLSVVVIIVCLFFVNVGEKPTFFNVFPVVATSVLLVSAVDRCSPVYRLFSSRYVAYIGKISYGLYLWHWPLIVIGKKLFPQSNLIYFSIVVVLLSFMFAIVSRELIEVRVRATIKTLAVILFILLCLVIYSYKLSTSDPYEPISQFNKTRWHGDYYSVIPTREIAKKDMLKFYGIDYIRRSMPDPEPYYLEGGLIKLYGCDTPEVVVIGDSHGASWSFILDEIFKENKKSVSFYSASASRAFFNVPVKEKETSDSLFMNAKESYEFDLARYNYLNRWRPKLVIISTMWSIRDEKRMHSLIQFLGEINVKVLLLEQPPQFDFGDKNALLYLSHIELEPEPSKRKYLPLLNDGSFESGQNTLEHLASEYPHVEIIRVFDIYAKDGEGVILDGRDVLYIDDDHLSAAGAALAKDRLEASINQALR